MAYYPRQGDPRVKIEWANKHIRDLETRINTFVNGGAYEIVEDIDTQSGENISRVEFKQPLDTDIPCLIGDILHNLRGALDHLIYRLLPATTDPQEMRRRAFPIGQSATDYDKAVKPRRIKTLRADLVQRIDLLEPYKGGKGHGVWQLHELNIIDKHRLLLTVGVAYHQVWRVHPFSPLNVVFGWIGRLRAKTIPLQDRATLPARVPSSDVNVGTQLPLTIAFNELTIIQPQPVTPTLVQFSNLVEGIVALFDDVA